MDRVEEIKKRWNEGTTEDLVVARFIENDNKSFNSKQIKEMLNNYIDRTTNRDDCTEFFYAFFAEDKMIIAFIGNGPNSKINAQKILMAQQDIEFLLFRNTELKEIINCERNKLNNIKSENIRLREIIEFKTKCCKYCNNCELEVIDSYPDMEKQDGSYTEIRQCTNCHTKYATYFIPVNRQEVK